MSTYGRLWEERKRLRDRLGMAEYATFEHALAKAASTQLSPDALQALERWRQIEKIMDACDSETGEPP
jgi:hypothetical protein